jgi:hypothetical protein
MCSFAFHSLDQIPAALGKSSAPSIRSATCSHSRLTHEWRVFCIFKSVYFARPDSTIVSSQFWRSLDSTLNPAGASLGRAKTCNGAQRNTPRSHDTSATPQPPRWSPEGGIAAVIASEPIQLQHLPQRGAKDAKGMGIGPFLALFRGYSRLLQLPQPCRPFTGTCPPARKGAKLSCGKRRLEGGLRD